MTIIKQDIKTQDMKREVREIRETARKIAVSKEVARHFFKTLGLQIVNSQRVLQGLQGLVAQQFVDVVKVCPAPDYVLCPDVIPMPCTV